MSLETVKSGFISYLTEKFGEDAGNNIAKLETLNSSASIFMYSEEFKEYLVEEYNADASIFSKSMNEIMQMDFENGEITDPNENKKTISQEDMANFIDGVDNPENYEFDMGFSDGEYTPMLIEETGEGALLSNEQNNIPEAEAGIPLIENSADETSAVSGVLEETQPDIIDETVTEPETEENTFPAEAPAGESSVIPESSEEAQTDIIIDETVTEAETEEDAFDEEIIIPEDNTVQDEFSDGITDIEPETEITDDEIINEEETPDKTEEAKYNKRIKKMLDTAYKDKNVIEALDTDKDGKLSDEEKEAFENYVKGDNDKLKREDLEKALRAIEEGKFTYDMPLSDIDLTESEETEPEEESSVEQNASPSGASGASGASGGYGGGYAGGLSTAQPANTEKGLTIEELETKREEKEGEVTEAQSDISRIYSGENEAVKNAKEDYEDTKKAYEEAVEKDDKIDQKTKDEQKENLNNIEEKEKETDTLNGNISDIEFSITEEKGVIDADESNLQALQDSLSALDSVNSTNSDKQAEINAKRAELESAVSEAEEKLDTDKEKLEELEDKKKDYEDKLQKVQDELAELEKEKSGIEKIISENASKETKDAMKEFNEARDNAEDVKEQELSTAKANLNTKQNELDEINKQINDKKAEQTKKDNAVTSGMQAAVEWARQYDNMSQSQMQQVFSQLGYQFDSGAWCADFVRMALGEGVGDENLPDWYKGVDNKAYCPSIASAGNGHQVKAEEAETGDIVLYDWNGDGTPDHVGLFVDNGDGSSTITAIEGNTSGAGGGSCVEEKSRSRSNIYGIYSMRT